ncbi:serine O-acetyltransferase EpsC [Brevibacterium sp. 91QC2O2]|uniref:serine O-acetyltransferase EpsC n=1 Tax=Brevibacterium sp. 91QC2O2 TaxID=2968458 RepID=UPI0027B89B4D|nr:serine O-acetyltransferase EpsC [Brevibacterium sp. 91QC2O2]
MGFRGIITAAVVTSVAAAAASALRKGRPAGASAQGFRARLREDLDTVKRRDPAAQSDFVTVLSYPGMHAIWAYRGLHRLWAVPGGRVPARLGSQLVRAVTGVEIHPGATIGRRFFIDHADGIVVGETAEIGDDVMLYHQVTLGGTSMAKVKRHPTVGDDVLIGAGAKVLGPVTIGAGASVGANAVVIKDVPADAIAVGIPAVIKHPHGVAEPHGGKWELTDPAIWI